MNLDVFFTPRSVAIIGASRTPGKVGHDVLLNITSSGFEGDIIPINPSADSLLDLHCYPNLQSYGKEVDLAIIVVPREIALEAVRACADYGVRGIVVISSGFREMGEDGHEVEKKMVDICRRRAIRLLGPNCMGIINTDIG
ncbi:MAG: CoA-binding protein, partial [Deltaproteobacteria bacterium]|nr:CoA-binding protein [Deltaproteobacteria bacterium]